LSGKHHSAGWLFLRAKIKTQKICHLPLKFFEKIFISSTLRGSAPKGGLFRLGTTSMGIIWEYFLGFQLGKIS